MPNYQVKTYATIEEDLSEDEIKEYLKCAGDCQYFIENYVRVQHPTLGSVLFKLYDYQERTLSDMNTHNQVCLKFPRQSGKTSLTTAYILWRTIFNNDMTVGIAAHKGSAAKEVLGRLKYAYENLPEFLKPVVTSYNVHDIAFDNGSSVLAQSTTENTFRGMSLSLLYCLSGDTNVTVRNKETKEIFTVTLEELYNI